MLACAVSCAFTATYYFLGWPELYICTVYDRIFGDFTAKNIVYILYIGFWPTQTIFSFASLATFALHTNVCSVAITCEQY
jgi:hypothetical protein